MPSRRPPRCWAQFDGVVRPFLEKYCFECHRGPDAEAELDLAPLTSMTAAVNEPRWGLILEMLESGEMPADDAQAQPTPPERDRAVAWFRGLRAHESPATPAIPAWCWRAA